MGTIKVESLSEFMPNKSRCCDVAMRREKPIRVRCKGPAVFWIAGERIVKSFTGNTYVGSVVPIKNRPSLTIDECHVIRDAFLDGCNEEQILIALGRRGVDTAEVAQAMCGDGRYKFMRWFYPHRYTAEVKPKPSASGERIFMFPGKPLPRLYCQVCGRRRKSKHIRESKRSDLSVWCLRGAEPFRIVACSRKCRRRAKRFFRRDLTWIQDQQYWIGLAKKRLKMFRQLVRQRSRGVA